MKKLSFLMVIVLAFGLILTACSSSKDDSSSSSSDGGSKDSKDKDVTLVYARGKDTTDATKSMIAAFEKEHPNIHIKVQEEPNDTGKQHDAYVTAFNAKSSAIDVINMDVVWPAEFAQAGYTLPLDRFIQQDNVDLSQYNKGALSAAQFNGKQWALPIFIDAGVLFYRTDLVKSPPKTWDELIADAKKFQGKNGTKYGMALQAKQYEGLVCNAVEYLGSYGGAFVDSNGNVAVNSPETVKGLKELKKVAVDSGITPDNVTNFEETDTDNSFVEGQTVFARNWPYMWADANDKDKSKVVGKVGVAAIPAGDKGSASALGGWQMGINKYSKHPQEAWEFLKFMTGKEGEKIQAIKGGSAPAIMSLYQDPDVLKANPFFKEKGFTDAVANATSRPVAPNYQEISSIIQIHVSKMLAGQETPEQSAANMEKEMKAAMK
ncbi:multiple sugar transport system substrate-binding protein [Pullulanibacillus pueri]|uniref:Putative ABC transporter-binding protein n=1 Tax=Pullulanibacillus pueri TaxID=1437324 RepID=A0A8J3EMR9_9BACL|nr:ABC transporter substrate-binding protein [Pullulanibacillus pueri]MBM7682902.1 multiple sugar transport system substrate-binding protein [Pullulanibacillus pueri]GGH84436.1 putative ABC transporter-binding protein [Pullulanibacillus pueri]